MRMVIVIHATALVSEYRYFRKKLKCTTVTGIVIARHDTIHGAVLVRRATTSFEIEKGVNILCIGMNQ
jgi:hypothetical protein